MAISPVARSGGLHFRVGYWFLGGVIHNYPDPPNLGPPLLRGADDLGGSSSSLVPPPPSVGALVGNDALILESTYLLPDLVEILFP